eukprot:14622315-Alexandrium_andersonii.AAC.1
MMCKTSTSWPWQGHDKPGHAGRASQTAVISQARECEVTMMQKHVFALAKGGAARRHQLHLLSTVDWRCAHGSCI